MPVSYLLFFLSLLSLSRVSFLSLHCRKKNSNDRDACLTLSATNRSKKRNRTNRSSFSFSLCLMLLLMLLFSAATHTHTHTRNHMPCIPLFSLSFSLFSSYLTQSTIDLSYINIDAFVIDVTPTYFITVINLLSKKWIDKNSRNSMKTKTTKTCHQKNITRTK